MPQLHTLDRAIDFGPNILVRDYEGDDRKRVFSLLSFLPDLYPGSFNWLERRLADVERGRAYCTIALVDHRVAGVLIDIPKGGRTSKICTLYVQKEVSGSGLGTRLLKTSANRWYANGVDSVYVTVASLRQRTIDAFLKSNAFIESARLQDRYGPNRDEFIYSLKLN